MVGGLSPEIARGHGGVFLDRSALDWAPWLPVQLFPRRPLSRDDLTIAHRHIHADAPEPVAITQNDGPHDLAIARLTVVGTRLRVVGAIPHLERVVPATRRRGLRFRDVESVEGDVIVRVSGDANPVSPG